MDKYIIQKGDTLTEISKKHYGTGYWSKEVASHNRLLNPNTLYEGQTLELPPVKASFSSPVSEKGLYEVRYGDTLWKIAEKTLGDPNKWTEIARLNSLSNPDFLFIGQPLRLPPNAKKDSEVALQKEQQPVKPALEPVKFQQKPATAIPGRALFILSDEVNPFRSKLVRKDQPGKVSFQPKDMNSKVTPGRHVMGDNKSKFISTSRKLFGAPRFKGSRYWIDVNALKNGGVKFYTAAEIEMDLQRIEAKYQTQPKVLEKVKQGRAFLKMDKEVLVEGPIQAYGIKNSTAMTFTRSTQVLQGAAIVLTAYELGSSAVDSYEQGSVKPLAKETIRQAGGWGGTWLATKIGFEIGAAITIETGPGALIGGLAGALFGGFAGFFCGDWVAGYIDVL